MPKRQKFLTPAERAERGLKMAKYKTGTIYSGRANVRIVTENGTETQLATIGGAYTDKLFDKALATDWDYENDTGYMMTKRVSPVEKVAQKFRVKMEDVVNCPSFEIFDITDDSVTDTEED